MILDLSLFHEDRRMVVKNVIHPVFFVVVVQTGIISNKRITVESYQISFRDV